MWIGQTLVCWGAIRMPMLWQMQLRIIHSPSSFLFLTMAHCQSGRAHRVSRKKVIDYSNCFSITKTEG